LIAKKENAQFLMNTFHEAVGVTEVIVTEDVQNEQEGDESAETRLTSAYETIRRREYELITNLLELLPKIDTLGEDRVAQVRDALFHADHPFLMVFVGPFSSGKSMLINALLGEGDLLAVGPVPTTDRISILRWGEESQSMDSGGEVDTVFYPSPLLKKVSFVDTPGLESVFQKHEEITRKFLHRSDVVMLVMLATQAMTQRNVEYLQKLREYGKKVLVVVNQADLLSEEEAETVQQYVMEQSQDRLKYKPEVWLVSGKQGLEARAGGIRDEELWQKSGLQKIEDYINEQLSDVDRLRQKLQTPLQIIQNAHGVALEAVKVNQAVLDQYQGIAENVQQQLEAYKREQDRSVREVNETITAKFSTASQRGGLAIRDVYQLSRAFGSVRIGFLDLIGISRLFRRGDPQSKTRVAFEKQKVFEPIEQLLETTDKLGPRLEGKDLRDTDDLVKYAQKEIDALPPTIQGKVIGNIRPPSRYDRAALQTVRSELETIEAEARQVEVDRLDQNLKSVLFGLAVWELLIILSLVALALSGSDFSEPSSLSVIIIILVLGLLGLLALPLIGRILQAGYVNRMLKLQNRYIEELTKAADKQIEYGMTLRRDVVSPLTRLVETQTQIQTEQMNSLQTVEQEMVAIEAELAKMGKRNWFGLRG
jgi:GTP-binding protein EngB required for normal cell division